jgi:UDP-GlcNAc:undecaprenyl-phosphate/decaprenyl-phosphate GlcNAc-1-phosphate transferase
MFWLFVFAFSFSWLAITLIRPHASRLGLMDTPGGPNGRKTHAGAIPVIGGIAIALAFAPTFLLRGLVAPETFAAPAALLLAMAVIAGLGALDDRHDLSKLWRFVIQIVVGCLVATAAGATALPVLPWALGLIGLPPLELPAPLVVVILGVAICALINAVNWLDGADGLLGSLTLVSLLFLAPLIGGTEGDFPAVLAITSAGAVLAFLSFNLRRPGRQRAAIFMGDAGSGLIAVVLAYLLLVIAGNHGQDPLLMLGAGNVIFLADMAFVIAVRLFSHGQIWKCDRMHLHHRLTDRGFEVNDIVLIACAAHSVFLGVLIGMLGVHGLWPLVTIGLVIAAIAIVLRRRLPERAGGSGLGR